MIQLLHSSKNSLICTIVFSDLAIKEDEQIVEPFQDHSNNQAATTDYLHSNYFSYRIKTCNQQKL